MNTSFDLLHPEWLYALLVLPAVWLWRGSGLRLPTIFTVPLLRYPLLPNLLPRQAEDERDHNLRLNPLWIGMILLALIISLAQPVQRGDVMPVTRPPQAVDLILLANTSVSMALKDSVIKGQQVDRMQQQKDWLKKVVERFQGDRIALVILGRPAAVWLPLTRDKALVMAAIERLQTTLGGRNSDISASLKLVQQTFPITGQDTGNEKIILLSTDAYQQLGAEPPQKTVTALSQQGYRIHTLAIGSTHIEAEALGKSHLVYLPVDIALLQQLALLGKGRLFRASDNGALTRFLQAIERDRQPQNHRSPQIIKPLYPWPLLFAMLLLAWPFGKPLLTQLKSLRSQRG